MAHSLVGSAKREVVYVGGGGVQLGTTSSPLRLFALEGALMYSCSFEASKQTTILHSLSRLKSHFKVFGFAHVYTAQSGWMGVDPQWNGCTAVHAMYIASDMSDSLGSLKYLLSWISKFLLNSTCCKSQEYQLVLLTVVTYHVAT